MEKNQRIGNIRHSLAHLLAAAVLEIYPDAKNTIGPAIENGFYYDFDFPAPIGDADLPAIEEKMRQILKNWKKFESREVSTEEAKKIYKNNPYKIELVEEIVSRGEKITLYKIGSFEDLCRGGHVESAKELKTDAFALSHLAGAYWRGSEKNKMLTRIYGLAFASKEELDKYKAIQEEAKKRDHKRIGKELDLFTFSDLVGSGLPLWTPKGTLVRDLLDSYVSELRKARGYQRVDIPHITKKELYEVSGHWEKFKDELLKIETRENHIFAMKPMNCPHHIQIFARRQWSYREMPERYATTTKVYRDEQTGELSGLLRTRAFTQDDAHVFCRKNQIEEEVFAIWDIIDVFYRTFGFGDMTVRFSHHDPAHFEKYLGTKDSWEAAEKQIKNIIEKRGVSAIDGAGEAAMYGPKIDFLAKDSLRREWQVATIQLDFNQPERFDLFCVNEKGELERIALIHCAIMGSLERFLSIIIEHYAGAFPLWLSPVQAKVLPISEKHNEYAKKVCAELKAANIRAEVDDGNETLGKKIRDGKTQKIPYLLVVGDKEADGGTVSVESRGKGALGSIKIPELIEKLKKEISDKK